MCERRAASKIFTSHVSHFFAVLLPKSLFHLHRKTFFKRNFKSYFVHRAAHDNVDAVFSSMIHNLLVHGSGPEPACHISEDGCQFIPYLILEEKPPIVALLYVAVVVSIARSNILIGVRFFGVEKTIIRKVQHEGAIGVGWYVSDKNTKV